MRISDVLQALRPERLEEERIHAIDVQGTLRLLWLGSRHL